jgi:hypothetical protein
MHAAYTALTSTRRYCRLGNGRGTDQRDGATHIQEQEATSPRDSKIEKSGKEMLVTGVNLSKLRNSCLRRNMNIGLVVDQTTNILIVLSHY